MSAWSISDASNGWIRILSPCTRDFLEPSLKETETISWIWLNALRVLESDPPLEVLDRIIAMFEETGRWLGQLYQEEHFDFKEHPDFIQTGKSIMSHVYELRKHMGLNPDFIFVDRTRYGLLRLFERMNARVRFRNSYEV